MEQLISMGTTLCSAAALNIIQSYDMEKTVALPPPLYMKRRAGFRKWVLHLVTQWA